MTGRALHRWLSGWAAVAVIGWALSGLAHPLMSLLGPRAATFAPPSPAVGALPADWHTGLQAAGVTAVSALRLVMLEGDVQLQLAGDADQPLRYAARAGGPYLDRDAAYGEALARHFSGQTAAVASVAHITAFSSRYPEINRVLPAWRVRFDGGIEVDVSTAEDRLIGISDARRRLLNAVFRNVHTLAPLDGLPWLRVPLMLGLLIAVWMLTFAGIRIMLTRAGTSTLRRAHRWGGALLLLPLLAWTGTGAFQLLHGSLTAPVALPSWNGVTPDALAGVGQLPARRVWVDGGQPWVLDTDGRYQDGRRGLDPADMARQIADIDGEVDLVTAFSGDYGFVNRRLPVWRVTATGGESRFVDLGLGRVVARVNAIDRAELWSFNQVHKWQLADGLGRARRDALMSAVAALLIGLAGLGVALRLRRARRGANA